MTSGSFKQKRQASSNGIHIPGGDLHKETKRFCLYTLTRVMSVLPEGFLLQPDFLTPGEEEELTAFIGSLTMGEIRMHGVTAKRKVKQFGFHYSFDSFRLTPAPELPPELLPIRDRAAVLASVVPADFSEALVTAYPAGAGIGWHRDAPPFGIVAGISLGASCRMRFQKGAGPERVTAAVELPPRSIYLLTGPARQEWQHTIPAVKQPRYSVTFRTLRRKGS
jgi:DNA oxidative demethylase